jgi:ligand-binding sensor domain-containing protein/two-component sensor histidine kinase
VYQQQRATPAESIAQMRCIKAKTVISLALWALGLLAVSSVVNAERLPIKTYTTGDGLANNTVYRTVCDSRGFLWFCTFEGLSRFDGYGFRTFGVEQGLPTAVVNDLMETREGVYWVATAAGLCRFSPQEIARPFVQRGGQESTINAMFTVYFPDEDAGSRNVTTLLEDSAGVVWCGTGRGLYRLEQQGSEVRFHKVDLGLTTAISALIEDRRGSLWVGTGDGLFRLLRDGRVERFHKSHGLLDNIIYSLLEDREGRIWVGTQRGLCRLVPHPDTSRKAVARAYTEKDGLPTLWVFRLFQASDGSLWAGGTGGLVQFIPTADGQDYRFRAYAKPHGLSYQEVTSLAEDRNGNLWLGMSNGGAARIARSGITAFGEMDGFPFFPHSIFRNQSGDILVLVAGGHLPSKHYINRFDGERFTQIQLRLPRGVRESWGWNQLALEDRAGEWWVGTNRGAYRFPKVDRFEQLARTPPKAVYTLKDGLGGQVVLRLFEDSRGDIWIAAPGGTGGLSRWERASETFHHYTAKDGLPFFDDSYPISFAEDRAGNVWIGFSFAGGSNLVRYRGKRFTNFTSADGIPEGGIYNLFVDSAGRLWVPTTRGGVCRIDNPQAERPAFSIYTTADGLASNSARCVAEDRRGRIYVGTSRGIDRLDLATGHIRHYTTADGLLLGDPIAALQDSEGALWFTSPTGVVRLIPEPLSPPLAPPILITGLTVAGNARPLSALGETVIAPLELSPGENQLQIDFVALGYSPGEGLRYQYRLEGATEEWSPMSEQRMVNFNLAPGCYRFLVRATNADGVLSKQPASFAFTILPPIYQRWWFIALAALIVGLAIYSLFRYRLAQKLEVERVRTRIAADLHDDIGANLTKIGILSEVVYQQVNGAERVVAEPISSIARITRESVAAMGDIVWAINPRKDSLRELIRHMREFAGEIFSNREIEFDIREPSSDISVRLGADVRRTVFLVFKEAVNNIVRHSDCRRADIEMRLTGAHLVLQVSDDGRGFDPAEESEGNGLLSMQRRAAAAGGEVEIASRQRSGTRITLRLPIKQRRLNMTRQEKRGWR